MSAKQCPACDSATVESVEGIPEPACKECGLVISDEVEVPEESDEDMEVREDQQRWTEFVAVTNSTEKQTALGMNDLLELSERLTLSEKATLSAAEVFAEAAKQNLAKGRSWRLVAAAALCNGAREAAEPRPTGRIAEFAKIESNELQHAIRLMQRELSQGPISSSPVDYVAYLCDDLGLASETVELGEQLIEKYSDEVQIAGKDPVGIAAAAVYEASSGTITQREIADAAGITQETIRVRLNEVRQVAGAENV